MNASFAAACALLGLSLTATVAAAQTQTVYATGMPEPANLSFNAGGQLFAGRFNGTEVFVAAPGGGAGSLFTTLPTDVHYAIIGPDNALYVTQLASGNIIRYAPGSTAPDAAPYVTGLPPSGNQYAAIAFDSSGRLYATTRDSPDLYRAPAGGGAATVFAPGLGMFHLSIAIDAADNIYAMQAFTGVIRRITPGGVISVFSTGNSVDAFSNSFGLAIDSAGNVYAAEYFDNIIYRTGPGGGVASVYLDAAGEGFTALTVRNNLLYVGNYDNGVVYAVTLPPFGPPAGVPTLSEWAMILLALGLAGSAAAVIHRRRQAA